MSKFKVGDRVKRLDSSINGVVKGQTYTVSHFDGYRGVKLEGYGHFTFNAECFELVPALEITSGDYIDSREFTREECERFCELAVECGFGRGCGVDRSYQCIVIDHTCNSINCVRGMWVMMLCKNNITIQFREFLDKEKGMKQFTKDDLKDGNYDGCKIEAVDGKAYQLIGDGQDLLSLCDIYGGYIRSLDDFTWERAQKVTDRDGTVLFERDDTVRQERLVKIESLRNELNKLEELL